MRKELLSAVFMVMLLAVMIPAVPVKATPDPGLVGLWHFDEGEGITAYDSSGNDNHGTLVNMDATTAWVPGRFGMALDFDGDDDYLSVSHAASLDVTGRITIEAWINPDSIGPYQEFVSKGDFLGGAGTFTYFILIMHDGKIRFGVNVGASGDYVDSASTVTTGEWQHVAATFDPDTDAVNIYIDGNLDNSGTITNDPLTSTQPLFIGALKNDAGVLNAFDGKIDEVRIWNIVLTGDEIMDSYTGKLTAILYLEDLKDEITALSHGDFKKPGAQRQKALCNKINAVIKQIEDDAYKGAVKKLNKDIRPKLVFNGKSKWVVASHPELIAKIDVITSILGTLI